MLNTLRLRSMRPPRILAQNCKLVGIIRMTSHNIITNHLIEFTTVSQGILYRGNTSFVSERDRAD